MTSDERQKGVLHEASPARIGRKSAGLGHRQQIAVLIQDGETFGNFRLYPGRTQPAEQLAGPEINIPAGRNSVQEYAPRFDALQPLLARKPRPMAGEVLNYTQARGIRP